MAYRKMLANFPCWCGSGKKYKKCHEAFDERIIAAEKAGHVVPDRKLFKTAAQIQGIRDAAVINRACLDAVAEKICVGMSTQDIDDIVTSVTKKMGGISATLGYEGFPKSCCTSINDQVCHGIPSEDDILEDGDIINVDCTTILNGCYADSSRMFLIGDVDPAWKKLVEVTKECVDIGIREAKPWRYLGDMASEMNKHARAHGYEIVEEIGGHGCGNDFHEDPFVSYVTEAGTEMLMVPGMVFTIEPMINMGEHHVFVDEENDWTVYTEDGSPSAQWEVEVLITEDGNEILCW
ncbi:MAG: type I methionyl aminopeptidase [Lachnospiraceae bacterium]|nr:type I methionyl aminopeptidase [Lachnospiraceae bacterium]